VARNWEELAYNVSLGPTVRRIGNEATVWRELPVYCKHTVRWVTARTHQGAAEVKTLFDVGGYSGLSKDVAHLLRDGHEAMTHDGELNRIDVVDVKLQRSLLDLLLIDEDVLLQSRGDPSGFDKDSLSRVVQQRRALQYNISHFNDAGKIVLTATCSPDWRPLRGITLESR
jgi:hypothetical protein